MHIKYLSIKCLSVSVTHRPLYLIPLALNIHTQHLWVIDNPRLGRLEMAKTTYLLHIVYFSCIILASIACDSNSKTNPSPSTMTKDMGEMAGEMTAGEMTAGEMTVGEMTAGEMTAGEMTAGEMTAGEMTAGEMTAGEMTAGEMTAGEMMSTNCQSQMSCLMTCEMNDFACRQRCVIDGRTIDQDTLESAKICIDRSGCNDLTCAYANCVSELLACEQVNRTSSCEEVSTCLSACGEDAACIVNCTYASQEMNQSQLDQWTTCLTTQSCEQFTCESCSLDTLCMDTMTYELNQCTDVINCISMCGTDTTCVTSCLMRSSPEAQQLFNALVQCMQVNMCGSSQDCITNNCNSELLACATNQSEMTPSEDIETCMDLNACLERCADGDTACNTNCVTNTPQEALDLFMDLDECSDMYMCEQDVSCLSSNCQQELVACVSDE